MMMICESCESTFAAHSKPLLTLFLSLQQSKVGAVAVDDDDDDDERGLSH